MTSSQATRPAVTDVLIPRSAQQQALLDRIAQQRERLKGREAARQQALAVHQREVATLTPTQRVYETAAPWLSQAVAVGRQHPLLVVAGAGLLMWAGPARLIRWTRMAMPIVMPLISRRRRVS